jgi:hypothetical protein
MATILNANTTTGIYTSTGPTSHACDERFDVFTAVSMKNAVFWDVAPCRYCVNKISTRRHIPEDGILHACDDYRLVGCQ